MPRDDGEPAFAESVEGSLCGTDIDTADFNSVDVVNTFVVSGVYDDASFPGVLDSVDNLFLAAGDVASETSAPAIRESVEGPLFGEVADARDCNSVDFVM